MKSLAYKKLEKAANKVVRSVNAHFKKETSDSALSLNYLVSDVFYHAFGYELEQHLLPKLLKKYKLVISDNGGQRLVQPGGKRGTKV